MSDGYTCRCCGAFSSIDIESKDMTLDDLRKSAHYWQESWNFTERMLAKVQAEREELVDRIDTVTAERDELTAIAEASKRFRYWGDRINGYIEDSEVAENQTAANEWVTELHKAQDDVNAALDTWDQYQSALREGR